MNNQFVVVCQHFYIWLNFPSILSLYRFLSHFLPIEFHRWGWDWVLFASLFLPLPLSLSLFLPLLSRLYCALSSIFYDCIVRGSKLEGNEYYKVEHNFKTLLRRLGFCFHFDFLLTGEVTVCYFLFIGNSFACLLFCYLFHWILFILERRHSLCGKCVNVTISYVYRVCEDLIQ